MTKKIQENRNGIRGNETESRNSQRPADRLTEQNIESIVKLERSARAERTESDLVAQGIARFCGSMTFVWVHVIWFSLWILLNLIPGIKHIDPFPFTFLTLVVSLEAIFLSTFILISQNQDAKISERRNHLDLQINLLSEQENTRMLVMLQAIARKVGAQTKELPDIESLREDTQPEKLALQIKQREEQ